MKAISKAEFKQWQALPVLSRPPGEGAVATGLSERRVSESTGPSLAKPVRTECLARSGRKRDVQAAGKPPENISTPRVSQRP